MDFFGHKDELWEKILHSLLELTKRRKKDYMKRS